MLLHTIFTNTTFVYFRIIRTRKPHPLTKLQVQVRILISAHVSLVVSSVAIMSNRSSSWIDLLQRNGLTPTKSSKMALRISESTPKVSKRYILSRARWTHCCVLFQSHGKVSQLREEVVKLRGERRGQSELLEQLSSDNSRLISQVSLLCGLWLMYSTKWVSRSVGD